jgi:hypothetical protein
MLHITNGDSVVASFRDGGIPGTYLPWRDVLHDGPVPQSATLEALSDLRARVVCGSVEHYADTRREFAERDRTLRGFRAHDETVLWFEHDLYDQLQLLQLLDWFFRQDLGGVRLSLIQIDRHPEVSRFYGLGQLNGGQLAELLPRRKPVTPAQLAIGHDAWHAFCAPDPRSLLAIASRSFEEMPFLQAALTRAFEEYPAVRTGLSRTERQLLAAAADGARRRRDYFLASSERESCPWGDLSVYWRLDRLADGPAPAIDRRDADDYAISDRGRRLLAGADDWAAPPRTLDVWIGGVHVSGPSPLWRWDADRGTLVTPSSSRSDT